MNKIAATAISIALVFALSACGSGSAGEPSSTPTEAPAVERSAEPSPEAEAEEMAETLCADVKAGLDGLVADADVSVTYSDEKARATIKTPYAQEIRPEEWNDVVSAAVDRTGELSAVAPVILQIEASDGAILATVASGKVLHDVFAEAEKEQEAEAIRQTKAEERANELQEVYKSVSAERAYVLNNNTMKFHEPTCSSAKDIKSENREETVASRNDLLDRGYSPCGRCKP